MKTKIKGKKENKATSFKLWISKLYNPLPSPIWYMSSDFHDFITWSGVKLFKMGWNCLLFSAKTEMMDMMGPWKGYFWKLETGYRAIKSSGKKQTKLFTLINIVFVWRQSNIPFSRYAHFWFLCIMLFCQIICFFNFG